MDCFRENEENAFSIRKRIVTYVFCNKYMFLSKGAESKLHSLELILYLNSEPNQQPPREKGKSQLQGEGGSSE